MPRLCWGWAAVRLTCPRSRASWNPGACCSLRRQLSTKSADLKLSQAYLLTQPIGEIKFERLARLVPTSLIRPSNPGVEGEGRVALRYVARLSLSAALLLVTIREA
ncbi:hypothetical protein B0T21DRAFT_352559 [Apiosordaria backusii]|uniref:Uncharacterized protein n=1 Tax=Apiosordaria backusii TaxID=314023 RepID=A0AA40DUI7_9PEZI|nr:hypothetical protein B0T21DRAFT_352559 [Apiosordaria backusii]